MYAAGISVYAVHILLLVAAVSVHVFMNSQHRMVWDKGYVAGVVEEFGKFKRLLKPGFNMINPCTEEVAEVDLRIKLLDAGQHSTITKDNVKVVIKASLAYRVTNPIISYYVLRQSLNKALVELCTASLRTVVGNEILDEVLTNRSKIAGGAKAEVMRNMPPGIEVDRIFMEQIIIPPETEKDLTSAARQRRIS
jgi:regulator of protease activity HflC (stomatin/prohibitin superfamily)